LGVFADRGAGDAVDGTDACEGALTQLEGGYFLVKLPSARLVDGLDGTSDDGGGFEFGAECCVAGTKADDAVALGKRSNLAVILERDMAAWSAAERPASSVMLSSSGDTVAANHSKTSTAPALAAACRAD